MVSFVLFGFRPRDPLSSQLRAIIASKLPQALIVTKMRPSTASCLFDVQLYKLKLNQIGNMVVSWKVPVGNNNNSAWYDGGEQIGFAGPIECLLWGPMCAWGHMGPWRPIGPWCPMGPMGPSGRPPTAGAGRPADCRFVFCCTEAGPTSSDIAIWKTIPPWGPPPHQTPHIPCLAWAYTSTLFDKVPKHGFGHNSDWQGHCKRKDVGKLDISTAWMQWKIARTRIRQN